MGGLDPPPTYIQTPLEIISWIYLVTFTAHQQSEIVRTPISFGMARATVRHRRGTAFPSLYVILMAIVTTPIIHLDKMQLIYILAVMTTLWRSTFRPPRDSPDGTVCADDRIFLGVLRHQLAPSVQPRETAILAFDPEVGRLYFVVLEHWKKMRYVQVIWIEPLKM